VKAEEPIDNAAPTGAPTVVAQGGDAVPEGLVPIKAPFTGLFYRRPSPPEPAFVEVGSEVKEDTTVCLVEVMKCFSSIAAGVKGRVERILVENGALVEIGQVMFVIRPS
jgi:acetyl-CoA carboxylase biotin carboxyl carrier protein